MGVAENIRKRRLELNLSQQALANSVGYRSRSTIAKIESGEIDVLESKIPRIAIALDTTVEYIKNGETGNAHQKLIAIDDSKGSHKYAAIILAGGKSTRNMQNIPNQFVNVLGKPVIVYCLEAYQRHPAIDDIYVVCLKDWENILAAYAKQYNIGKLRGIIPGGETGIKSVRNGVEAIKDIYKKNDIIVLQESTRPLVTEEMISKLLNACLRNGSAVTCETMSDYLQFELSSDDIEASMHSEYLDRKRVVNAESPEAYRLQTILEIFEEADAKGHKYNETCFTMMLYNLGYEPCFFEGNHNNIKVVRQEDIGILSTLLKNRL